VKPLDNDSITTSGQEPPVRVKEVLRLIESDHKSTTEFIARLTTLRTAVRGITVPLLTAIAGLSLANKSWLLAVISVPLALLGAWAEAKTSSMLKLAHNRLVRLERKVQAHVNWLVASRHVAAAANSRLERELNAYQFGVSRSLRELSAGKVLSASVRQPVSLLYAVIAIALVIITITLAKPGSKPDPVTCLQSGSGAVIEVSQLPTVRSGSLHVVQCPGR
jgi:hypothetical protein